MVSTFRHVHLHRLMSTKIASRNVWRELTVAASMWPKQRVTIMQVTHTLCTFVRTLSILRFPRTERVPFTSRRAAAGSFIRRPRQPGAPQRKWNALIQNTKVPLSFRIIRRRRRSNRRRAQGRRMDHKQEKAFNTGQEDKRGQGLADSSNLCNRIFFD